MNAEVDSRIAAALIFLSGPLVGKTFSITQPITTIGRQSTNTIVIPDPKISRQHARILWHEGVWEIERLSESSSVTVAGQTTDKSTLEHQSIVSLGTECSFRFHDPYGYEQSRLAQIAQASTILIPPALLSQATDNGTDPVPSSSLENASPVIPADQPPSIPGAATEISSDTTLGLPSLEVTDHTTGVIRKYPLTQKSINIGRDKSNDIVIAEELVSARHLQIAREDEHWVLIHPHPDERQTRNGLLYRGRKIAGKKAWRRSLEQGDMFRIEDEQGNLITLVYNDGRGGPQIILPALQPYRLLADQITLGRLPDNDVVLNHPQVSAHHARLTREKGDYYLTDLNSSNHVYVNGIQQNSVPLRMNDEIRIGPFKLVYTGQELRQYDESESIRIDALELRKESAQHVTLLNGISLSIPPRSFVALVGSSGAGKSTLLDALSGLKPAQQGMVLYNGQDYYQHIAAFRSQLGYVPQEDIIHRDLTVERALYYAARFRLPRDFTATQIEQRVTEVLEDVEMTARRTLLIKKLSGGQRKRISIALELLARPSAFFLDEPTSGLDPGLDRKMMILLRKLADKGHTIILVTHATNNINICDYVCFLAQGGRLAYFGPPEEAKTYFHQPDFAEIYNALEPTDEHPNTPAEAEKRFKEAVTYQQRISRPLSEVGAEHMVEEAPRTKRLARSTQRHNPWKQFLLLSLRYLELLWNDKWNLTILLLQAPIIGVILFILVRSLDESTIFHQPIPFDKAGDAQRFLFIMSLATMMFGCINAAREIIKEEHIYRRERAVNLGILPYLLSKIAVLSALCLLQCMILIVMMNLAASFYNGIILPEFWEFYITLALVSIAGAMIGLTISSLVRNNDQAVSFIPLLLIPQVIFSGSMFPLKSIPLQIFGAIFSLRWAMAALGSILNLTSFDDKIFGTCASCNTYRHDGHYLLLTWLALVIGIVVLGVVIGIVLKRKDVRG